MNGDRTIIDEEQGIITQDADLYFPASNVIKAFEVPASESKSGLREKHAAWGELHVGDCMMLDGNELILYEDGTSHWHAVTRSSDTNDKWESKFLFYASNGWLLFIMPDQTYSTDFSDT